MAASLKDFLEVKNSHAQRLLLPSIRAGVLRRARSTNVADAVASAGCNIHGIGVGTKMVEGKPTEDLCIRIYVIQKLPKSLIAPLFRLPETLDGLPTDIIESAPTVLLANRKSSAKIPGRPKAKRSKPTPKSALTAEPDDSKPFYLQSKQRPLFGGLSAANVGVIAGTLGWFCRSILKTDDSGDTYILSNRHILGKIDGEPENDEIRQPSVGNNGLSDDCIAQYTRAAKVDLSTGVRNKVDAAIARILPRVKPKLVLGGIGRLGGPVTVENRKEVWKCGQATGLTKGVVTDISKDTITILPLPFDPQHRSLYLAEQIRIDPVDGNKFIDEGDSGSIVVDGSNGIVGLICGGDPKGKGWAVANRIQNVLESLQVELL